MVYFSTPSVTAYKGMEIVDLELGDVGNETNLLPGCTLWKLCVLWVRAPELGDICITVTASI